MGAGTMPEWRWVRRLFDVFEQAGVEPGQSVVVLRERATRDDLVAAAELALDRLGADVVTMSRGTGDSVATVARAALEVADFVADLTPAGLAESAGISAVFAEAEGL
jgi:hypothetical protein